jgi:lysozyme
MRTSDKGIHLMHQFEGYRDRPYKCSAKIWTVGWGHALYPEQLRLPNARTEKYQGMIRDEFPLKPEDDRLWTKPELEELFRQDLLRFEHGVLRLAPNLSGNQGVFDACVALSYNIGLGNFQRSSVRQRINRDESKERIAEAFMVWSKAGGKVLRGLQRRREAETRLFL